MAITVCSMQMTLKWVCAKRTVCQFFKSVWVQRLRSEETDERISDKTMEEDYFKRFLKHLIKQCTNARKCVSGRPRTYRTAANISDVNDLVLPSQEGAPQTHLTLQQIGRKTFIHRLSVVRIIRDDLRLQVCEKTTRTGAVRNRSKSYQLL